MSQETKRQRTEGDPLIPPSETQDDFEARPFASYEMVQMAGEVSASGSPRYHIYGIRPNGLRVGLDKLYLSDVKVVASERPEALQQAREQLEALIDERFSPDREDPQAIREDWSLVRKAIDHLLLVQRQLLAPKPELQQELQHEINKRRDEQ